MKKYLKELQKEMNIIREEDITPPVETIIPQTHALVSKKVAEPLMKDDSKIKFKSVRVEKVDVTTSRVEEVLQVIKEPKEVVRKKISKLYSYNF